MLSLSWCDIISYVYGMEQVLSWMEVGDSKSHIVPSNNLRRIGFLTVLTVIYNIVQGILQELKSFLAIIAVLNVIILLPWNFVELKNNLAASAILR
jgi:hypothetical protein